MIRLLVAVAPLVAGLLLPLVTVPALPAVGAEIARAAELKRVIDRNTGFAHMTRGMNMYTLIALRSCVSERDVPVLVGLLTDRDHVTQLAAANVLADLGEPGKRGLQQALAQGPDVRTRLVIEEALQDAESPTRRPIQDYPLTAEERRRIRGCSPPSRN